MLRPLFVLLCFVFGSHAFAQSLGDYRTDQTGQWGAPTTWQVFVGGTWQQCETVAAGAYQNVTPSTSAVPSSGAITIQNNVTVAASVTADQVTLTAGTLTISAGQTLTIADSGPGDDFTNTGGTITVTGTMAVNPGAVYNHARNGGAIPLITWGANSTCLVTGILGTSPTLNPASNYEFFTWDCIGQTGTISLAGNLRSVAKDLLINDTNKQQLRFATNQTYTLTIGGDFTVQGGNTRIAFCTTASNVVINATGNFAFASSETAGSLLKTSGTYTFTMNDFVQSDGSITASTAGGTGTFNIKGNFEQSPGTTLTESGAGNGVLSFVGTSGIQTIDAGGTISNTIDVAVNNLSPGGGIQLLSDFNVGGAVTETAGNIDLNGFSLTINGNFTQSSGSIVTNPASQFILQGTGTLPAAPVSFSGTDLLTLTINQTGTLSTSSALTLTNLNLLNGTLNSNTITMIADGIVQRSAGSISSTPLGTSYDLLYTNAGAINSGPELPASSTLLGNLTKQGAGTLTINQADTQVNGDLTLSSGTFALGSNNLILKGNMICNAAFTTTPAAQSTGSAVTFSGSSHTMSGSVAPSFNKLISSGGSLTPNVNYNVSNDFSAIFGSVLPGSGQVTFNGSSALQVFGGPMNLGAVTIASGSTLTASSGAVGIAGNFVINNTSTFNNNGGTINFNGATVLSGAGTKTFNNVTVSGSLTTSGTVAWRVDGILNNTGTINTSGSTGTNSFGGTSPSLIGSGTTQFGPVVILGGATLTTSAVFSMTTLNINASGVLTANADFSMTGNFTGTGNFSSTATVTFAGGTSSMTAAGTKSFKDIVVNNGAVFSPAVSCTVSGNMSFVGTGNMADPNNTHTFTFTGTPSTIDGVGTGNILFDGITVSGGASLQVNRNITIDNTFTATGGVTAANGVAVTFTGLTMSGAGPVSLHDVVVGTGNFTPNANYSIGGNLTVNGNLLAGNSTTTFTGTGAISGAGGATFNFLTIASGASVTSSPGAISVVRDFRNDGAFIHNNGTVTFSTAGTVQQQILGNASTTFFNLNISNVGVATDVTNGVASPQSVTIMGTLNFTEANAVIDADGAGSSILIIGSTGDNPVNDGRIASLAQFAGTNVTGNVTVQRYMSFEGGSNSPSYNNGRIYRYLSTPVQNPSIAQWQDDFYVTGSFPGAHNGSTPGCTGCTTNPSLYYYDSSIPDYVAFPGGNILTGVGYAAFIRNNLTPPGGGTPNQPITIDVTGTINSGAITINNISPLAANWNLVGNPYPSPIAWNNAGVGTTNIAAGIAIRDNGTGTAGGILVPLTVGQKIPAGQAFWVRANADGPATLVINESDKTTVDASTIFYRAQDAIQDQLSIKVTRSDGKYDESFLSVNALSSQGLDQYDIPKKNNPSDLNNDFIDVTTASLDGISMLQNAIPQLNCAQAVNIKFYDQLVTGGTPLASATFNLSINPTGAFAAVKWILQDAYAGITHDFSQNPVYNFTIDGSIPASLATDRLTLSPSADPVNTTLSVTGPSSVCEGSDPVILIGNSQQAVTYGVELNGQYFPNMASGTGQDLTLFVSKDLLQAGTNTVVIKANSGCEMMAVGSPLTIDVTPIYVASAASPAPLCASGTVELTASGAPNGGSYRWYDSVVSSTILATTPTYSPNITATRSYFVAAVNAEGCEGPRTEVIAAITDPTTSIDIFQSSPSVCKGTAMTFTAVAEDGQGKFFWYATADLSEAPLDTTNSGENFVRTLSKGTTFFVRYSPSAGCLRDAMEVHGDTYTFNPALQISSTSDAMCEGQSNFLTVSGAPQGASYKWFDKNDNLLSTTPNLSTGPVTKESLFKVMAYDEMGCASSTKLFVPNIMAVPDVSTVTASLGAPSICQDTEAQVTITNPLPGATYRWYESKTSPRYVYEGQTLPSTQYASTQSYFLAAVNSIGCETPAAARKEVAVAVKNFAEPVIEMPYYGVLKSSYSSGNQWYLNGEALEGEVAESLRIMNPGYYSVLITKDGCQAGSGVIFTTDLITSISDESRVIRFFPNPVSDKLTVHVLGDEPVTGQLLDEQGRSIATIQLMQGDGQWSGELDVRSLARGFYLLRLSSGTRSVTHKVIIK
jgi:hypothetical protein